MLASNVVRQNSNLVHSPKIVYEPLKLKKTKDTKTENKIIAPCTKERNERNLAARCIFEIAGVTSTTKTKARDCINVSIDCDPQELDYVDDIEDHTEMEQLLATEQVDCVAEGVTTDLVLAGPSTTSDEELSTDGSSKYR